MTDWTTTNYKITVITCRAFVLSDCYFIICKFIIQCFTKLIFRHYSDRFKLRFGYLQLDNQLPLTLMPVLLAPEQSSDVQHPVFKMTITMQNENKDGVQVYPYVYIRVCFVEFDAKIWSWIFWFSFCKIKFKIWF